ncbi:hypothetical protein ISCGN_025922 [Ixodes scapularis]
MPPRFCIAENCGNDLVNSDIPIYKFPNDDKFCALWIRLAGSSFPTWVPTPAARLCADHFRVEDYERCPRVMKSLGLPAKKIRLKRGVLPCFFSKKRKTDQLTRETLARLISQVKRCHPTGTSNGSVVTR